MLVTLHRLFNRGGVGDYSFVHLASLLMLAGGAALLRSFKQRLEQPVLLLA